MKTAKRMLYLAAVCAAASCASGHSGAQAPTRGRSAVFDFGGLEERRVTFSAGRDITLSPAAAAGPVNHLPKCWVEQGGKPVAEKAGWTRKFTYRSVQ